MGLDTSIELKNMLNQGPTDFHNGRNKSRKKQMNLYDSFEDSYDSNKNRN